MTEAKLCIDGFYLLVLSIILISCNFNTNSNYILLSEVICKTDSSTDVHDHIKKYCYYEGVLREECYVTPNNKYISERKIFAANGKIINYQFLNLNEDFTFERNYKYNWLNHCSYEDKGDLISYFVFHPTNTVYKNDTLMIDIYHSHPPNCLIECFEYSNGNRHFLSDLNEKTQFIYSIQRKFHIPEINILDVELVLTDTLTKSIIISREKLNVLVNNYQ